MTREYLALAPSGRVVASFGTAGLARDFLRKQRARQVNVSIVEQVVTRRPVSERELRRACLAVVDCAAVRSEGWGR
jgi:hypothetical protein